MKVGQIIPGAYQRLDIVYRDGTFYGGLHCGNTLDVLIQDVWRPTRIEYSQSAESWYLVGFGQDAEIIGLTVRN